MKDKISNFLKKNKVVIRKGFIVLVCLQFLSMVMKSFFSERLGWDHEVYCHAATALNNGLDPYLIKNIGLPFSYTYPAIFLPVYSGMCAFNNNIYILFDAFLLLGIVFVLHRYLKSPLLLALPFVFFGCNATYWNFQSGNLGILEGFLFVLALLGITQEKWWGSIFLVPMGFLKIVPAIFALPFGYLVSARWMDRFKSWAVFGVGLVSLALMNYVYSPSLFTSFLYQIAGKHPDQHSPASELTSDKSNPTVPLFFKNLAALISADYWGVIFIVFLIALLLFSIWLYKKTIKGEVDPLYRTCWTMLIMFLWLPRLKPYSFVLVVVCLVPLLSKLSRRFAFSVLILSVFHRVINGENPHPIWGFVANNTAVYTLIAVIAMAAVRWEKLPKEREL